MLSRRFILATALVIAAQFLGATGAGTDPSLQLPWPSGEQHRINGGYTYGCGTHGGTGYESNYHAIDFSFPNVGSNVSAVATGTIEYAQETQDARGNYVQIDHSGGLKSRYLHLRSEEDGGPWPAWVQGGAPVAQGQVMGYSGDTGGVAPHLHFDMKLNGAAYKAEPMSGVPGAGEHSFWWYGYSVESGVGWVGCLDPSMPEWDANGCTYSTCGNVNDPSPSWAAYPPCDIAPTPPHPDGSLFKEEHAAPVYVIYGNTKY